MPKEFLMPEPRYIIDKTGKKVAVILDVHVYEQLLEVIEDFCLGKMAQEALQSESKSE